MQSFFDIYQASKISRLWLIIAVIALAISGIYSILMVSLRSPQMVAYLPFADFFDTALISHVNLSVLVWMLSIANMLYSFIIKPYYRYIFQLSFYSSLIAVLLIAISAFIPDSQPLKNNYIPVLQNLPFLLGITLFLVSCLINSIAILFKPISSEEVSIEGKYIFYGIYSIAPIFILAFACFIITYLLMPDYMKETGGYNFYEYLFWGGGHILQFLFAQLLIISWLFAYEISGGKRIAKFDFGIALMFLNLFMALPAISIYIHHPIDSMEYMELFTKQMRYVGGVAVIVVAIFILRQTPSMKWQKIMANKTIFAAHFFALLLFGFGGVLGFKIDEQNVVIPAHYHGAIIGISLAMMAMIYQLLPFLGYNTPKGYLFASQPYIYGLGQLAHIGGLAWMGGYGALRKTPGEVLPPDAIFAKILFMSGGGFAVLGGLFFVIILLKILSFKRN